MKARKIEKVSSDSGRTTAGAINISKDKTTTTMRENTTASSSSDIPIIAFRTDKDINDMLEGIAAELKLEICYSNIVTDLIAFSSFMNIINPKSLTAKDMEYMQAFFAYLKEAEDSKSLCIIFTSHPAFKIPKGVEKFIIKTPAIIDEGYLRLKILNKRAAAARHNKQNRDYDRKIFRLLKIFGSSLKCMGNQIRNIIEIRHQEMKEVETDHYERYGTISVGIGFDAAMACGVV